MHIDMAFVFSSASQTLSGSSRGDGDISGAAAGRCCSFRAGELLLSEVEVEVSELLCQIFLCQQFLFNCMPAFEGRFR